MNWKTSHNILYIILFKIFISKLDYFFIIYTILLSLSSLDYSQEEIYNENGLSIQQHQINSYLKGPENQSVLFNTNTIMSCRVYYKNYIISKLSIFYEDYLSVQWIIDGFGVNNESLKDVHGDRYSMPGSIEQGNFDLRIRNAQLEDEASFICQANIKIYSNSGLPPQLDTITSKPAYLTVIYPPSELTLLHLPEGQTLATINPLSIPSNKHSPTYTNGLKENHYSTEDLGQIFDRDLSRIVADDPESESSFGNSKQFIDPLSQITDEQQISQMLTLKPIAINQIAPSQPTFIHNSIPKLWIPENKHLVVACRSSPSKPATSIQWHLAGTLLIKHPDLSKYFEQHSESDQSNKSYFLFNDHNHLFRYSIEEKVVNVSDKSLRKDDRTHGSEIFVSTSERNSADDVQMQVTQSQLTLFIERKYQHWQLECGVSNPEDFKPAKLPTITASIEPMYIENVKIRIVNYTDQVHFREDQSVNFECITNTNPKSPLYSWTIGNSVPSVEYETLSFILDSQSDTKRTIDNEHEHSLIGIQSDVNTLELTVNRAMHQKRIRCWVGVESPDLMYQITNGSLQGFLSNKDSSCVSDCRKLRNSLRKRLKNMIWAKGDYRLDIMYGPAFLNPMNDLYSGELGQIVNLECSADSNPEPNVFWYYIGPEGQTLLEDLTRQELNQYQHDHFLQKRSLINKQQSKHIMWNSETELVEFNTSVLKSAIFSHGRKLLTSKAKHVSHQLHLLSHANFGFYACIAQSPGYPAIYRAIYVGQAASPKVVKVDQWIGYEDNSAKLFCLVYSIPRPTVHQIIWSKNGIVIKPDKRLRIYQEKTHRGATSVLAFRILRSNDFSSYNCTVFNDYGSDWKLITLSHDNKPLRLKTPTSQPVYVNLISKYLVRIR
ncbi:unnamed protein product [Heterobilharzia americana]|nr:unnamed protein product [Heterobilharzia americana]